MIPLARSHWKIASTAVLLGLVGSCAAALALSSGPSPAAVRRLGDSSRRGTHSPAPLRLAPAQGGNARLGVRLMHEAAAACQSVPYSGVQFAAWWGGGGATASVVQVWHRPGSAMLAQAADTEDAPQGSAQRRDIQSALDQDGVLWESPQLLELMQANFSIDYAGRSSADARPAEMVELHRPDGSLAARFWLDAATSLPLRREVFDDASHMISEDAFISVAMGSRALSAMPDPDGQPWTAQLDRAGLASLRSRGWPVPARLSDGLALFAASHTSTSAGEVADLSYSDGLSVVSLFVQRGQLPSALPGWHSVTAGGHIVYTVDPDERSLAWSAGGFVYTLIADAPPSTVSEVVAGLPHQDQPGFWVRMARGFRRLASWANPFS